MKSLINKIENKYIYLLYLSIFSIFISNFKIYVVLFMLSIAFGIAIIINNKSKIKFNKWQISLIIFIFWAIISSAIASIFFNRQINISMLVKINVNLMFLIVSCITVGTLDLKINKEKLITLMEMLILANFLQIIYIYISAGLISELMSGILTKNSDSAYIISAYNIIIGNNNKNIWASKFLLLFISYLYCVIEIHDIRYKKRSLFYSTLGIITVFLILSRTSQLALIVPLIFIMFYSIRDIDKKYKITAYLICSVLGILSIIFLITKFFHIKFDITDGGYTRLYIWNRFIKNVFKTHFILGNGLGYSETFISQVVKRQESNLHNVYMNLFFELGLVGVISYISFLIFFVKENITKSSLLKFIFIIAIPFLITTSLQYLGFDNDLVIIFLLVLLIVKVKGAKEDNNKMCNERKNTKKYIRNVGIFALIILSVLALSRQESNIQIINTENSADMLVRGELNKRHKEAYIATMNSLKNQGLTDEEIQVKINEARQKIKEYEEFCKQVDDSKFDDNITTWGTLLDTEQQRILEERQKLAYQSTLDALENDGLADEEIQVKINEARQKIKEYKKFCEQIDNSKFDNDINTWGVLLDTEQQKILDKRHKAAYQSTLDTLENESLNNEEAQVKINKARQAIQEYKDFYSLANEDNDVENEVVPWGVLLDKQQQKILDNIENKINNYINLKTEKNKQIAINAIPESMSEVWKENLIQRINDI